MSARLRRQARERFARTQEAESAGAAERVMFALSLRQGGLPVVNDVERRRRCGWNGEQQSTAVVGHAPFRENARAR